MLIYELQENSKNDNIIDIEDNNIDSVIENQESQVQSLGSEKLDDPKLNNKKGSVVLKLNNKLMRHMIFKKCQISLAKMRKKILVYYTENYQL